MEDKIKELIEIYIKGGKIKYKDLEKLPETLKNEIIKYCLQNNIEIDYKEKEKYERVYDIIREIEVLSQEEIAKLIKLAQQGNEEAKNKIIEHNLRLVMYIANEQQKKTTMEYDDLFQSGCLGLYKAIEKFDISSGYKFSNYAYHCIESVIKITSKNQLRTIRIPVNATYELISIKKYEEEFYMLNGYYPTSKQIATALNLNEKTVIALQNQKYRPLSLDLETEIKENLIDEKTRVEDTVIEKLSFLRILDIINQEPHLSERDKTIFKLRYGLDGKGYKTLEEIGEIYDLTRGRIDQIEKRCIRLYQRQLQENIIDYYGTIPEKPKRRIICKK